MDIVSACPLRVESLLWQPRPGVFVLTVVCKATYTLLPAASPLAEEAWVNGSSLSDLDLKGKVVILSSVPSLDTKVCSIQTRRFNKEAGALGKDIQIVTLSEAFQLSQATMFVPAVLGHGGCFLPTNACEDHTRRAPAPRYQPMRYATAR